MVGTRGCIQQNTRYSVVIYCFSLFFLVHSINSRTSDGGPHSRLSSPPPHYGSCLAFYQEKTSEFLLSLTRDEFIRLENTK